MDRVEPAPAGIKGRLPRKARAQGTVLGKRIRRISNLARGEGFPYT